MMRITEGQLRKIIREELLRESAMNPQAAARRGVKFRIEKRTNFAEIRALGPDGVRVAFLSSRASSNPCRDPKSGQSAWEIDGSESKINGLGPLLYDLMIDLIHPHPLMSDRTEVSDDARRVWDYYHERRPDIESIQLDDLDNTLTPVEDDNCEQNSAMIWSDDNFGDEDSWPDSSLSKAYRRAVDGTPTLDELQELGLLRFI
jgi:hypothetical protein